MLLMGDKGPGRMTWEGGEFPFQSVSKPSFCVIPNKHSKILSVRTANTMCSSLYSPTGESVCTESGLCLISKSIISNKMFKGAQQIALNSTYDKFAFRSDEG